MLPPVASTTLPLIVDFGGAAPRSAGAQVSREIPALSAAAVAVLDTGIDTTHADLADAVVQAKNFTDSDTELDRYGHGTHVASIITGSGAADGGKYQGVAPGCSTERCSTTPVVVRSRGSSRAWSGRRPAAPTSST